MRAGLVAATSIMLWACAHTTQSVRSADAAVAAVEPAADGRMRGFVESSRVTDFCPDQSQRREDERCVVTRGWDYDRGVTLVRTYDPAGRLIGTDEPPGAELSLTDAERARVEALVRADPRTRDLVNKPDLKMWAGGFALREPGDPFCDRGSRCIRAISAIDHGDTVILHSVVDLMADRVVYPDYPASREKAATQP